MDIHHLGSGKCSSVGLALVGLVAVLVYVNTLVADFTFDDNFAVITNGDVTNDAIPIKDLFKHDFWGQDITSTQSHKSYRPITILAFRLTHRAWRLVTAAVPSITQLLPKPPALLPGQDADSGKAERPPGLHPFPFHVLCVAMHAVASMLVLALCQHLFAVLERSSGTQAPMIQAQTENSSPAVEQSCRKALLQQLLMWREQPQLWQVPANASYRALALVAGLMFALHPVHTEAVAGVVGCAELICAALSCPALLLYFMAVDGRYAAAQHRQQQGPGSHAASTTGAHPAKQPSATAGSAVDGTAAAGVEPLLDVADAAQHWLLVLAAAGLAFTAALSKEIGITVIGTMLLYDLLLAPHLQQLASKPAQSDCRQLQAQQRACQRQLLRMLCVAATAVAYVKFRQWIAVKQLVAIYRKVENPIPFAESRLIRVLSTGYLHARYFWLLLMPLRLSADWSFSCIPLVEHWADARNVATLMLYCYLLFMVVSAGPLDLLRTFLHVVCLATGCAPPAALCNNQSGAHATSTGQVTNSMGATGVTAGPKPPAERLDAAARSRWRLMVLVGLVVAPFFPASNVLFYVGTFIGERLLYMPSIGFCLLAAELLGWLTPGTSLQLQQAQAGGGANARQAHLQPAAASGLQRNSSQQPLGSAKEAGQQAAAAPGALPAGKYAGGAQPAAPGCAVCTRSWCVLLLSVLLLVAYTSRTVLRNMDWWDEERLFLAALRVCPNSAKVQQNCGVLQRRYKNYTAALEHFRRAQEIEPGYCEPTYWIGLTVLNNGDPVAGVASIKASLSCKYTASEALSALNKVYMLMVEAGKGSDPAPMVDWAGVLASPLVLRIPDACATAEDAALGSALLGKSPTLINQAIDVCLRGVHEWEHGTVQVDTLADLTRRRLAGLNTTLLSQCVVMRQAVYRKLSHNPVASEPVRRAVYRYITRVSADYPTCRTLAGGGPLPVDNDASQAAGVPSSHQKLLHKVQAADPEDPWLQAEWGATLLALGPSTHLQEAGKHLGVSAVLFTQAAHELSAAADKTGQEQQQRGDKRLQATRSRLGQVTQLDGSTPLTP